MEEFGRLPPGQRNALARIMRNEGFVPRMYLDSNNPPVPTIGYRRCGEPG